MKLRLRTNTLRLRLTQGDLDTLHTTGRVEAVTRFGPSQHLTYALEASSVEGLSTHFDGTRITVLLPAAWVEDWVASDQVGFEAEQIVGNDPPLHVLVEKDFHCLHRENPEEDHDTFPHPEAEISLRPRNRS